VNFNTKGRNILLLKFTSQMTLDERGLPRCVSYCHDVECAPPRWNDGIRVPSNGTTGSTPANPVEHTFPVPPSPTSTSLKVGIVGAASAMVVDAVFSLKWR
jgi:hypothetical protein